LDVVIQGEKGDDNKNVGNRKSKTKDAIGICAKSFFGGRGGGDPNTPKG
jgi:hypothetical protein